MTLDIAATGSAAMVRIARAKPLTGHSILLVEDEPLVALEVRAALLDGGAEVVQASDAPTAARLIGDQAFTAAVLDINLGSMDCWIACRLLSRRNVPFLFHTGYTQSEILAEWPQAPVVNKPASRQRLIEAVADLLSPRAQAQAK